MYCVVMLSSLLQVLLFIGQPRCEDILICFMSVCREIVEVASCQCVLKKIDLKKTTTVLLEMWPIAVSAQALTC